MRASFSSSASRLRARAISHQRQTSGAGRAQRECPCDAGRLPGLQRKEQVADRAIDPQSATSIMPNARIASQSASSRSSSFSRDLVLGPFAKFQAAQTQLQFPAAGSPGIRSLGAGRAHAYSQQQLVQGFPALIQVPAHGKPISGAPFQIEHLRPRRRLSRPLVMAGGLHSPARIRQCVRQPDASAAVFLLPAVEADPELSGKVRPSA